jgi:1-aminocyclopropane-1-carboxylate deaminase
MAMSSMKLLHESGFSLPTPLQRLQGEVWNQRGIQVFMKREDERDDLLGGNKWCKLLGHLEQAAADGVQHLLSVGGLWSNHLHALAHAGQRYGLATTGIVRGSAEQMTVTLREAEAAGMQLRFVSRDEFRQRHDAIWQRRMCAESGAGRFIPEGGAGPESFAGLSRLAREIEQQMAGEILLAVATGSGTTLAGLRRALPARFSLCGFQAFADDTLHERVADMVDDASAFWSLQETAAMRRHTVLPEALAFFMQTFEQQEKIPLDPVYTVRLMARLAELMTAGQVPDGSRIIALHSGGLQGRRGHSLRLAA